MTLIAICSGESRMLDDCRTYSGSLVSVVKPRNSAAACSGAAKDIQNKLYMLRT